MLTRSEMKKKRKISHVSVIFLEICDWFPSKKFFWIFWEKVVLPGTMTSRMCFSSKYTTQSCSNQSIFTFLFFLNLWNPLNLCSKCSMFFIIFQKIEFPSFFEQNAQDCLDTQLLILKKNAISHHFSGSDRSRVNFPTVLFYATPCLILSIYSI